MQRRFRRVYVSSAQFAPEAGLRGNIHREWLARFAAGRVTIALAKRRSCSTPFVDSVTDLLPSRACHSWLQTLA
jgi:hypothetical protein